MSVFQIPFEVPGYMVEIHISPNVSDILEGLRDVQAGVGTDQVIQSFIETHFDNAMPELEEILAENASSVFLTEYDQLAIIMVVSNDTITCLMVTLEELSHFRETVKVSGGNFEIDFGWATIVINSDKQV